MHKHRFIPLVLIAALAATLLFAATAAAEIRTGETTSPTNSSIPPETDILGAAVTFDTTTGTATVTVTTAAEPQEEEQEEMELGVGIILSAPKSGSCGPFDFTAVEPPFMEIIAPYAEPISEAFGVSGDGTTAFVSAAKSVVGTKMTLIGATPASVGEAFTCASVITLNEAAASEAESILDEVSFPITTYVAPTPAVTTTPTPPPAPAPAALSLGKAKALTAKVGKWAKQKVTVTDTGGTAVGNVAIKASAGKGVTVRPGTTKIPALLPGQSWTFTVEVKLSAKAAKKSTISLLTSSGALSAKGSFQVTRAND